MKPPGDRLSGRPTSDRPPVRLGPLARKLAVIFHGDQGSRGAPTGHPRVLEAVQPPPPPSGFQTSFPGVFEPALVIPKCPMTIYLIHKPFCVSLDCFTVLTFYCFVLLLLAFIKAANFYNQFSVCIVYLP